MKFNHDWKSERINQLESEILELSRRLAYTAVQRDMALNLLEEERKASYAQEHGKLTLEERVSNLEEWVSNLDEWVEILEEGII